MWIVIGTVVVLAILVAFALWSEKANLPQSKGKVKQGENGGYRFFVRRVCSDFSGIGDRA